MGKITTYGIGSDQYDFSQTGVHQRQLQSNFGNMLRTSQRMVMTSGGFDRYGVSKAPNEVGTMQLPLTLVSDTVNGMENLRDNLRDIEGYGLVQLLYQPTNPAASVRFCYARATSVRMNQQVNGITDLHQPVQVSFEVPYPIWHTSPNIGDFLGINFVLGTSILGGTPVTINASGTQTDSSATNNGNAIGLAKITIATGAAQTCQNPTIQRLVNGSVVDEVSYTATLGNNQTLIIDARKRSVTLDLVNGFNANFDFTHPAWMRILPGSNSIRVIFQNAGDAATVSLAYFDNFYGA